MERKEWEYLKEGQRTTVYLSKDMKDKLAQLRKKLGLRSINESINFLLEKYLDLYLAEEKKPVVVERRYA